MRRLMLWIVVLLIPLSSVLAQNDFCDLSSFDAYINRGDEFYNTGNYERSIEDYTCAIGLDDSSANAYNSRGNAHLALGEYELAIADYEVVFTLETGNQSYIYYNRGTAYLGLNDYEKAEQDLNQAIELDPTSGIAYNNRGNIYYDQGDYIRAIEDYDQSIAYPHDELYIPYYNRGIAYYELGDYEESLASLNEAINLNPDYKSAWLARASTYEMLDPSRVPIDRAEYIALIETQAVTDAQTAPVADEIYRMTEGRVYYISFDANTGQLLNIAAQTVANTELDPLIVLLDDQNNAIASDDDSGVNLDAVIADFEIPYDGTFILLLSHAGGGTEGEITLSLTLDGAPSKTFATFALEVGQTLRVLTTRNDTLNLRSGPGLNFDIVTQMPTNTSITLLEGPRKSDGYAWWRVRTADGQEGWAVERADNVQTMQPPFIIGSQATVFPPSGDRLNVRSNPGRSNDIVTQLEPGAVVTILEGPQSADDLLWWKIRTEAGQEGWAVEAADDEQTLFAIVAEQ